MHYVMRAQRLSWVWLICWLTVGLLYGGPAFTADPANPVLPAFAVPQGNVYIHPGISGPDKSTSAPAATIASPDAYRGGSTNRLAILLTERNSAWLGLAHGLKSIGVPFILTDDYQRALKHKVVLVYPTISGKVLDAVALKAIAAFPRNGGTLIATHVLGGGLNEVFGFEEAAASKAHFELRLDRSHAVTAAFREPRELSVPLDKRDTTTARIGTYNYTKPRNPPLAVYEDGTAAITQKDYGGGKAYAFGIDIGFFLLKGYNNREEGVARSYVNDYEPALDVILRMLKFMYRQGEPAAVTLGTVPFGKSLAVVLSHDIDYTRSLENAVHYAEYEKSEGVKATYFIQTKYVKDWNDDIFFDEHGVSFVKRLGALGMEVASHSVSHSYAFGRFPLGTGDESYPTYRPFVKDRNTAFNGTVLGELRVSKYLLEKSLDGGTVISFRAGHLQNPHELPQALQATGYLFNSSVTANNSLTHLPFRLTYDRDVSAATETFEFPVTIEDEAPPKLGERVPQALELAKKLARYGACMMILIHPDVLDHKLEFERGFVKAMKGSAWFGTLGEFGSWWAARDRINIDLSDDRKTIQLEAPRQIQGLTLELPAGWQLSASAPVNLKITQNDNRLEIPRAEGRIKLTFRTN